MEAPITIGEAVLAIQRRDYLLPAIQREFVWTAEKSEDLFDSLLRGYPVGSFLFWKVSQENSQKYRFYEFMQSYDAYDNMRLKPYDIAVPKPLTVVLDGQQRLTSFTIGLLGYRADRLKHKHANNPNAYPRRRLYLNLSGPLPESEGVDRQYDFRFMTDKEVQDTGHSAYWFPVRRVLEFRDGSDVDAGKLMEFAASEQLNRWGAGTLARLCNSILKSPVVHYFQEDEQALNRVLNIFVRLNAGGQPLSYSDLLLSIASAQWLKRDAREAIFGLVDDLNEIKDFEFDKDFVLKSALVLTDLPEIGFSVDNFDSKNTAAIENGWDTNVRDPLMLAAETAAALGYHGKTLTSANVLIPVAYYLRKIECPSDFVTHPKYAEDRRRIRRWLINALLKSVFSAKTDTVLAAVRASIATSQDVLFPLADIEKALVAQGISLKFGEEELEMLLTTEYGKRNSFSVLAAIYPALNMQFTFHQDHVYPKSKFRKTTLRSAGLSDDEIEWAQARVNQIANLQLLEGVVNQAKLDTMFDDWIKPTRADPRAWGQYRSQHAIPDLVDFSLSRFHEFFEARQQMMLARLKAELAWVD